MKSGMQEGQQKTISVEVTKDMFAQFEGKRVHPTYSTVSMVYHMELASRQIILPYLEGHEEGMGGAVTVKHLRPATEGSNIQVIATLKELIDNTVVTEVEVKRNGELIGIGEVKQVILPKYKIDNMLRQAK